MDTNLCGIWVIGSHQYYGVVKKKRGDRRAEGEREKEGYASILSHMPQVVSRSVVALEAKKGTPVIRARIAVCAAV